MLMLIIDIYRPCISVFNMSQFFIENDDVLNFIVEIFFRFFTYDSYVILLHCQAFLTWASTGSEDWAVTSCMYVFDIK